MHYQNIFHGKINETNLIIDTADVDEFFYELHQS
jgi:hypothetical protein